MLASGGAFEKKPELNRTSNAPATSAHGTMMSTNTSRNLSSGVAHVQNAPFAMGAQASALSRFPFAYTPEKSGELNSSWLPGPSPTVNTRQAIVEVMAMFNNPLEVEHEYNWRVQPEKLNETERDFEDAFSHKMENRARETAAEPAADGELAGDTAHLTDHFVDHDWELSLASERSAKSLI